MLYGHVQLPPSEPVPAAGVRDVARFLLRPGTGSQRLAGSCRRAGLPTRHFQSGPARIWPTLDTSYTPVATFRGIEAADPSDDYDRQDAFYVPFANLTGVRRPGPTVRVFERRPDE